MVCTVWGVGGLGGGAVVGWCIVVDWSIVRGVSTRVPWYTVCILCGLCLYVCVICVYCCVVYSAWVYGACIVRE